jgi:hypothetical protein
LITKSKWLVKWRRHWHIMTFILGNQDVHFDQLPSSSSCHNITSVLCLHQFHHLRSTDTQVPDACGQLLVVLQLITGRKISGEIFSRIIIKNKFQFRNSMFRWNHYKLDNSTCFFCVCIVIIMLHQLLVVKQRGVVIRFQKLFRLIKLF